MEAHKQQITGVLTILKPYGVIFALTLPTEQFIRDMIQAM